MWLSSENLFSKTFFLEYHIFDIAKHTKILKLLMCINYNVIVKGNYWYHHYTCCCTDDGSRPSSPSGDQTSSPIIELKTPEGITLTLHKGEIASQQVK